MTSAYSQHFIILIIFSLSLERTVVFENDHIYIYMYFRKLNIISLVPNYTARVGQSPWSCELLEFRVFLNMLMLYLTALLCFQTDENSATGGSILVHVWKMLAIHSRNWISLCIRHISINYDTALHCSFKPNTWLREQDTPTVQTIKLHSTCCFICEQLVHNIMELFYIAITFYSLLWNSWLYVYLK